MNRLLSDLCDIWFICSCSHCGNSLSVNGLIPSVAYSIPWELLRVRDGGGWRTSPTQLAKYFFPTKSAITQIDTRESTGPDRRQKLPRQASPIPVHTKYLAAGNSRIDDS